MPGITIYFRRDFKGIRFPLHKLEKLVRSVCRSFNISKAMVDIAVVGNNRIRKLNARFLNRKTVTDCLSFDLSEHNSARRWFELIVNGQKAKREASKRGHSAQAELALYITHGLLHNLGFNDRTPAQAQKMHLVEDEILKQQGFGPVYDKKSKVASKRRQKC
jgi:probable rRNA maturation factor